MNIGDIYKHKERNSIIQIDSYATHMGDCRESLIIVFRNIEKYNDYEYGSSPSFNSYGTKEEIESEYELLVSEKDLKNYYDWSEIFDLL